ncbi:hypothetical protein EVAR_49575_1 [Eumeta japonica]|uniref:Uncharacterized protein n=1 Tax=Eumeta variegata TaxID=151549 RepID=A0A4C1YQ49_EUMVA|nr:hypothetical protein EVAR_49575_1 [Eumeta japonica]
MTRSGILPAVNSGVPERANYRTALLTYSSNFGAARLDPCELRTVVPYTYTLSECSASYMAGGVGGVRNHFVYRTAYRPYVVSEPNKYLAISLCAACSLAASRAASASALRARASQSPRARRSRSASLRAAPSRCSQTYTYQFYTGLFLTLKETRKKLMFIVGEMDENNTKVYRL